MSFRSRSIPGWVLALLLGLVALTSHPALRAQQSTPAVPTFRAGTEAVALDVVVLNEKGEPVEDLSQHEFEVFEDGNRRPITTFSVVKVSAVAPGAYVLRVAAGGDDLPNVVQELPIEVK